MIREDSNSSSAKVVLYASD